MAVRQVHKGAEAMTTRDPRAVSELRPALAAGGLRASDLVADCLARIEALEADVRAWAWIAGDQARDDAETLDRRRASGQAIGALHGLPVGIKDIIDVADMPCENGTMLDAGRVPTQDAASIRALKAAGAVILGKTVTTELAYFHPGKTRNPHDLTRTPGGSSSGSAAAVAAGMVPLAVGSQTNGSVIRPAAFCGVVGFKPSRGLIPTDGALCQAQSLDTLGVFATTVDGAALLAGVLSGDQRLSAAATEALEPPPVPPRIAFCRTTVWGEASADTAAGLEALVKRLGAIAEAIDLPAAFARGHAIHRRINMAELTANFAPYAARGRDRLSRKMQEAIDEGNAISAPSYLQALASIHTLNAALDPLFERFDAILTAAAPGEAPADLSQTGNPVFCTLWTLCGTPAITLPLLRGINGMPIGVQLVGRRGDDRRLLRTAAWLARQGA